MAFKLFNNGPLAAAKEMAKVHEEIKKAEADLAQEMQIAAARAMTAQQTWAGAQQMQIPNSIGVQGQFSLGPGGYLSFPPNSSISWVTNYSSVPIQSSVPAPVTASAIEELKRAEPRMAQKPVPDSITMLTGYRAWRVKPAALSGGTDGGWRLQAVGQETVWEPKKKMEAVCRRNGISVQTAAHPAPQRDCTCGFWAFKSIDMLPALRPG